MDLVYEKEIQETTAEVIYIIYFFFFFFSSDITHRVITI